MTRGPRLPNRGNSLEAKYTPQQMHDYARRYADHVLRNLKEKEMEEAPKDCLKITMEQQGCLIEVIVPEIALPPVMEMKEYMRNTGADMYARLYHMMQQAKGEDGTGSETGP